MIEMYKILSGKYDTDLIPRVNREHGAITSILKVRKTEIDFLTFYLLNRLVVGLSTLHLGVENT